MKRRFSHLFIATLIMTITISACSTATKTVETRQGTKYYNVPFGEHKQQKMDVFVPKDSATTDKIVLLVHGGGWRHGDKIYMRSLQNMLLKRGVATANINYRLIKSLRVNIAHQMDDISKSLVVTDSIFNSPEYILFGESAGAHLSLLYGYNNPDRINKIISLSGPTDFTDKGFIDSYKSGIVIPILNKLVGRRYVRGEAPHPAYLKYSPINSISPIPTLIIHGRIDPLVNIRQANRLDSALTAQNIPHKMVVANFGGHFARFNPYYKYVVIEPAIRDFILE